MITTVCKISYGSQTVPPIVPAVQGDTGRAISFEIADFTPPAGATATYFILKPSGEAVYNSATITDNSILCELTAQSLAEKGENRMQVRVLQGEDIVTSFEVILMVRPFLGDDAIESGTEMDIFDQVVEQATEEFQTNAEQIVEEVVQSIPADYTALTEEVSELNERLGAYFPEYSSTTPYAIGAYVTYEGWLYQCLRSSAFGVPAPEAGDSDYWRHVHLNEALSEIVGLVAPQFQGRGQSYAVGDYCVYNNTLYRCTTAIETAISFDTTKWEQVDSITNDYSLTVADGMLCVAYEE